MYPQELATAAQYGGRVIVLVVNNGCTGRSGCTRNAGFQAASRDTDWRDRTSCDGQVLWRACERVETTEAFAPAFERAPQCRPLGCAGTGEVIAIVSRPSGGSVRE